MDDDCLKGKHSSRGRGGKIREMICDAVRALEEGLSNAGVPQGLLEGPKRPGGGRVGQESLEECSQRR